MIRKDRFTRRGFLAVTGTAAFAVGLPKGIVHSEEAAEPKDRFRGLKVGIASYSTREFTLDQTIEMALTELVAQTIGVPEMQQRYLVVRRGQRRLV